MSLRNIGEVGCFKSFLYLIMSKFDKCIVLLIKLLIEYLFILLPKFVLSVFKHLFTDRIHLAQCE